ncbi:MAG: linear amide C-N hydrolase [Muribaculaceae bacterium]
MKGKYCKAIAAVAVSMIGVFGASVPTDACTRAVYLGPDSMVVTGRTMDWKEDPQSNLYLFPRGIERRGGLTDNTVKWTSRYGSVVTAGYDIGVCDGMNEKGLMANLLFLSESDYRRPNDSRPVMGLSIWTQYVLDNFATVDEAVAELGKELFRIDDPDLPNGAKSTLHLSISDSTGNSAIFEYINGNLVIHQGRDCRVMTNSPTYDKQLTLNDYWRQIGGLVMLPGTNRASDRFVRASFYITVLPMTSGFRQAVAGVFSVMRNVSVPLGISIPDQPNIASTRWRTVADQKNLVYYFESTMSPNIFWVDFKDIDFGAGNHVKKLTLTGNEIYAGNAVDKFKDSKPLEFLFGI